MTTNDIKNEWGGEERRDKHWHLDRRVPLAIIIALIFQTMGAVWWASKLDSRVAILEQWVSNNTSVAERLSVIETGQRWIKDALSEIKESIRRNDGR